MADITVTPGTSYQTIRGWEATAQAGQADFGDFESYKTSLFDQAVADGLNSLRLEIRIKDENTAPNTNSSVNDNADPFSINAAGFQWGSGDGLDEALIQATEMKTRLQAQGEDLFTVLCYVDFRPGFAFAHANDAEEYAELVEAAFIHINASVGWVPDAVEIILEPNNSNNSARWTPTKLANCLLATQSRLASHSWFPKFLMPSSITAIDATDWWNNVIAADSDVLNYIDELNLHAYEIGGATEASIISAKNAAATHGKNISMLEFITADYNLLHLVLKHDGVAFQQFAMAYDAALGDDGSMYYLVNHTTHTAAISSRMKLLRQYFKWIRRGAVRKGSSSSNGALDALAFENVAGNFTVVVKATSSQSFTVGGLPPGTYHIKYATASAYDQALSDQVITTGQDISTSIPAAGVLTIFSDPVVGSGLTVCRWHNGCIEI